ncbi:MAG: hypothetical protein R3B57_11955 [Phycisphaerales bacterium]
MTQTDYSHPVELIRDDPAPPSFNAGMDWALIFAVLGAVLFSGLTIYLWMRAREPSEPEERAFRKIAGRMGLSDRERDLVRAAAAAHGEATPSALLLSPSALKAALEAVGGSDPGGASDMLDRLGEKPEEGVRERLELIA